MSAHSALRAALKTLCQGAVIASICGTCHAGAIFLTGHDPDFHATLGGNAPGAIDINNSAINFVMDAGFNSFVSTAPKFLFVESKIPVPGVTRSARTGSLPAATPRASTSTPPMRRRWARS